MSGSSIRRHVRLVIALAALPLPVLAQELQTDALEEVVVTAQKRVESLRDVPLSVAALSGARLAEAGIVRLDDLKAYVPNLQITETGIANNIYIRGIGSGLNQGFEQSVSTYADGIYRGRGHQSRMPFLDLERIEVLRGPQPILFGKNAVAGAVSLISAKPGPELEGMARLSYDFDWNETLGSAMLSGPLTDTFGARAAVHYRKSDGYIDNLTLGGTEPRRDELGGRLTLQWQPTDALRTTLKFEGGNYKAKGRQIEIFGEQPIVGTVFAGRTYSQIISGTPPLGQGQDPNAANNVLDYRRSSNGDSSDLSNFETALTIDYGFGNDLTLTSVSGYSTYDLDERCDCDFVGATVFNAGITEKYHQYSQELRLASPTNQPLEWIAGAYFQRYTLDETDYLFVPSSSLLIPVLTGAFLQQGLCASQIVCAGLAGTFGNAANPRQFVQNSTLWSAFAQFSWHIADQWTLVAGGRYNDENKDGSRATQLTAGLDGPPLPATIYPLFASVLGIVPHSVAGSLSESNFSPLVNLQWHFANTSMAYLSWARGYKSGGFDARSNKPPAPVSSGSFQYGPERATTYELGLKAGIGRTAEINAAAYYTQYDSLQTSAFDGAIGFNVGSGSAEVKGVEVSGRWRATPQLMLSASAAYLDFKWTDYYGQCYFGLTPNGSGVNAGNCNYKGFTNQLAPKFTGVLTGDYSVPIGERMLLKMTADLLYSSDYLTSLTLDPATRQDAYLKVNARLALADVNNRWELALVGRNLTDKTTISYSGDTPLASRLFQARSYYGFVDPPRGLALEATVRF
jgi:outer membrane receptor protein involved in Fe transport